MILGIIILIAMIIITGVLVILAAHKEEIWGRLEFKEESNEQR